MQGNVYLAAGQIFAYPPAGRPLDVLEVTERPHDILFGSSDKRTLYSRADHSACGSGAQPGFNRVLFDRSVQGIKMPKNAPSGLSNITKKNMPPKKTPQIPFIQSLDRGLTILQHVALSDHPVTLNELADLLDIDRSSAFRLAHTLRRRGFLASPFGRKDYILGSSIWTLSRQYNWSNTLVQVAHKELKLLANQINETAHLAIREGKNSLFIDCAQANHVIAVAGRTGELVPLHCTAYGKALLADSSESELRAQFGASPLRKFTKNTITDIVALAKACSVIKKQGFATDEAEHREDLRCVAAPIRLRDDVIVGSIGISAPSSRFLKNQYPDYAEKVCKIADRIGSLLSNPEP